jgi:hypothetical protein
MEFVRQEDGQNQFNGRNCSKRVAGKLAVVRRDASTNMIRVLESIKENTIYEMPRALKAAGL